MVKTLSKVLYHGTKILVSTVRKSIQQEIELSREMAKIRYQTRNSEVEKSCDKMSLEEAQRVLNVSVLDPKEVEERYRHLFAINKGFRYLQSKVFRAKEVIDHELLNRQEILSEKPNNRQRVERKGKYLFFTYFVTSDKSHPAL